MNESVKDMIKRLKEKKVTRETVNTIEPEPSENE